LSTGINPSLPKRLAFTGRVISLFIVGFLVLVVGGFAAPPPCVLAGEFLDFFYSVIVLILTPGVANIIVWSRRVNKEIREWHQGFPQSVRRREELRLSQNRPPARLSAIDRNQGVLACRQSRASPGWVC
jgi:hypothetical protein